LGHRIARAEFQKQFMNELVTLCQQISDLEKQVAAFDLDGDTLEDRETGTVAANHPISLYGGGSLWRTEPLRGDFDYPVMNFY
jgi:hypothetical protein